ncbi:hypothetical protein GGP86_001322 [Salinibacter ruber]|uniref:hypothetical protein n=1 Tax=Salinibacter ruber TaxID=146919 RepID=UPI002168B89C|nr:hypothetical protein [Salinibacter ruber]MCS3861544.1 hypothetical protein [Salinibacter ruber]
MILLPLHAAATLVMFGVILIVQRVHYPLFHYVRAADYEAFQAAHMRRITWIVGPAMAVELTTAGWIVWAPPPTAASSRPTGSARPPGRSGPGSCAGCSGGAWGPEKDGPTLASSVPSSLDHTGSIL